MINKPTSEEYAPFYAGYVNLVKDNPVLEVLDYMRDNSYNFFKSLSTAQSEHAYAEGKWTIKQLLGHMIDAERTFAYRILCFSRDETVALPGFDENVYVHNANFGDRSITDLAGEFKAVRESSMYLFRSLTKEQLTKTGIANNKPVSVRALIYITAGHEMHHINIIKERYIK